MITTEVRESIFPLLEQEVDNDVAIYQQAYDNIVINYAIRC